MPPIFDYLQDAVSHERINDLLARPRYSRAELLAFTVPRIDSGQLTNWLRHDVLDLRQVAVGNSSLMNAAADHLQANEELPMQRRRYTGCDVLKILTLNAIRQIGLPLSLSKPLIQIMLNRALEVLLEKPSAEMAIHIVAGTPDKYLYQLCAVELMPDTSHEWEVVLHADRIIARCLKLMLNHSITPETAEPLRFSRTKKQVA